MLDILGIESTRKTRIYNRCRQRKNQAIDKRAKKTHVYRRTRSRDNRCVPIKSVGGGKTLEFLSEGSESAKYAPQQLILMSLLWQ